MNDFNTGHEHWQSGRRAEAVAAFERAQAAYDELLALADPPAKHRDLAAQ